MSDFNQDIENLLNAYDSNWEDYLILREQFIEKYILSVDKLQKIRITELKDFSNKILQAELKNQKLQEHLQKFAEENERLRNALEDIRTNTPIQELLNLPYGCACHNIASDALAAIGGDDE